MLSNNTFLTIFKQTNILDCLFKVVVQLQKNKILNNKIKMTTLHILTQTRYILLQ